MEVINVSDGFFARCVRAQTESVRKVRVVYYAGQLWRVKSTWAISRRVHLELVRPRRSIDDCTLAEWRQAALENRKR